MWGIHLFAYTDISFIREERGVEFCRISEVGSSVSADQCCEEEKKQRQKSAHVFPHLLLQRAFD